MVLHNYGKYVVDVDELNNIKSIIDSETNKIIIEGGWKITYNHKRLSLYKEYKWFDGKYYHTSIHPPNGKGEFLELEY